MGGSFSDGGGFIFKWGECPMGGIGFDEGGFEKIIRWGAPPPLCLPAPPWETVLNYISKTQVMYFFYLFLCAVNAEFVMVHSILKLRENLE